MILMSLTTHRKAMTNSTVDLPDKYIILAYFFDGNWVEATYKLNNPEWRLAVQTLCETGSRFKMKYV